VGHPPHASAAFNRKEKDRGVESQSWVVALEQSYPRRAQNRSSGAPFVRCSRGCMGHPPANGFHVKRRGREVEIARQIELCAHRSQRWRGSYRRKRPNLVRCIVGGRSTKIGSMGHGAGDLRRIQIEIRCERIGRTCGTVLRTCLLVPQDRGRDCRNRPGRARF